MSFRTDITPYTEPHPDFYRPWALIEAQATACQCSRGTKGYPRYTMKINLPALEGAARRFTRATFYTYCYSPYTASSDGYLWFNGTSRYVSWTSSTTWNDFLVGLAAADYTNMAYSQRTYAASSDFSAGWYGSVVGGPGYGIGAIYEENSYSSCQVSIHGGVNPPTNVVGQTASYGDFDVIENRWDPDNDQDYYGFKMAGWYNGLTEVRCFILFEYFPPYFAGVDPNKMFWRGKWAGAAQGVN